MTGGALLSVFWAREIVEQDASSTAQLRSLLEQEDTVNLLLRTRLTVLLERYITALTLAVGSLIV